METRLVPLVRQVQCHLGPQPAHVIKTIMAYVPPTYRDTVESDIGAAEVIESRLTCTLMAKYLVHVDRTSQTSAKDGLR
jgi:hypothetical protein